MGTSLDSRLSLLQQRLDQRETRIRAALARRAHLLAEAQACEATLAPAPQPG